MTQWEYKVWRQPALETTLEECEAAINKLGQEGWELVAYTGTWWFKRRISF